MSDTHYNEQFDHRGGEMATPPPTETELVRLMDEITVLRERLDNALRDRDATMARMRRDGYSYEKIAKVAGDFSHVGVIRALRRRRERDERQLEAAG
jgi:hypothetical protein